MPAKKKTLPNNLIAEWFGHRIFPIVVANERTMTDQRNHRCPFLTRVEVEPQECVKPEKSKGVCTISSTSNGPRQDWVVCPYRIFDGRLIDDVTARVYGVSDPSLLRTFAAPTLAKTEVRTAIQETLAEGRRVLVYFDEKLGGEISLRATSRSPEMSFDVTLVEVVATPGGLSLRKFAILEAQTMDFHGSYAHAVSKLKMAVNLFPDTYGEQIQSHPEWAAEKIEGPNIANVVKRTLWQTFFKFGFGATDRCAGTALVIPQSVWDSWQPFLGAPQLAQNADGTYSLTKPGESLPKKVPAWIYVIDIDTVTPLTPNRLVVNSVIATTSEALVHYALVESPRYAADALLADAGIYMTLQRRIKQFWPQSMLL
jgi:hypothetical protein